MSYDSFIDRCAWLYRDLFHAKMPAEMYVFVNAIWISLEESEK